MHKYIISDACYVLEENQYDELTDIIFKSSKINIKQANITLDDGTTFFYMDTGGDGDHRVSINGKIYTLPVDASNICIFRYDDIEQLPESKELLYAIHQSKDEMYCLKIQLLT